MHRLMLALVATTALCACATAPAPTVTPVAALEPAPEPIAEPAPKPQFGTYGFDVAGMDPTVSPGDDFYDYASGTWQKNTPIPADKAAYGMFTLLADLSRERTKTILEEAMKDPSNRAGNAYASFLDEAAVEAKGLAPFEPWLDRIRSLDSKAGYAELAAAAKRIGITPPVSAYVNVDDKTPDKYSLIVTQSGLGMPGRDYYLSKDAKIAETRAKYLTHVANMLRLAGEANADRRARALVNFETRIAEVHWKPEDSRDATKTYNPMTLAQLVSRAPGFDFRTYLAGLGGNVEELIVSQPSAVTGIARLVRNAPLQVLKDHLLVRSLDTYADYLPKAFDQENFAFFGTALAGTPQQQDRWKRAADFTTGVLSDEVSREYVARFYPPETKAKADELVANVVAAMGRRIDQLTWMAPETKVRAKAKLANFSTKIGYPTQWRDMSSLEIRRDDLLGNAMRSNEFEHADSFGRLGQPIRKWEWQMTPMEVNAYADFGRMEIVFPAAILQPPFFDPNADPALNYGGIGAVIGHEISHHFDDQGAKYDEQGRLVDWWTPNDVKAFGEAGKALIAQYDAYEPLPGMNVKGALTLGENIGDLAGLTIAYDAYKASLGGQEAPVIDGTTGDERFYLGWAQVWRNKYRDQLMRMVLLTDPHSPPEQRVWVVRNLDPWYSAFEVQPGQKLYLPPEQRVRVW